MAVAASTLRFIASPPNPHPRNTATTGFTNAYVDTAAMEVCRRSHV
jgi:hypothetical protein